MKVYFSAYNPNDIIALSNVGAKNVLLPSWYAKKYFGKKLERLDDFKSVFPNFAITISGEPDTKFLSSIEHETDFIINEDAMVQYGRTMKVDNTTYLRFIKKSFIGEIDDSRFLIECKNLGIQSNKPTHLINMFRYISALKYPWVHSISVSDWFNVAEHKHLTVFDKNRKELETIDFRHESNHIEFNTNYDKNMIMKYFYLNSDFCYKYNIESIGDIYNNLDRSTLLKLPFVWYYMPILDDLGILNENFK